MRIAAHNQFTGTNMSLFRQQRMAHTRFAKWIIVRQVIFTCPLIQPLVQFGAFNVFGPGELFRSTGAEEEVEESVETARHTAQGTVGGIGRSILR